MRSPFAEHASPQPGAARAQQERFSDGASFSIGTVTAAGVTTIAAVQVDPVAAGEARDAARAAAVRDGSVTAATRPEFDRDAAAGAKVEKASKVAGVAGFAAVAVMLLTLAASAVGGFFAARCGCTTDRVYTADTPEPMGVVFR